jgi:hypothetical protein
MEPGLWQLDDAVMHMNTKKGKMIISSISRKYRIARFACASIFPASIDGFLGLRRSRQAQKIIEMNMSNGQDWTTVVFSKKPTGAAASASKNVRAVRSGQLQQACGQCLHFE